MKRNEVDFLTTKWVRVLDLAPQEWVSVCVNSSYIGPTPGYPLKKEIHRKQGSMQTHRLLHILLVPRRKRGVLLEEVRGVPYRRGH